MPKLKSSFTSLPSNTILMQPPASLKTRRSSSKSLKHTTYFQTQRRRPNTTPREGPTQTLKRRHTPTRQAARVLGPIPRVNSNGKELKKTMASTIITTKTGGVSNTLTGTRMILKESTPSIGPSRTGTMRLTARSPKTT